MLGLLNRERLLVGYDIGEDYAQISYAFLEEEVETLSSIAGEQKFNIPAVLCKKPGANQWLYGKEALRYAQEQDGILVDRLLCLVQDGEPVQIDGESYLPEALLALFMKRSLGLLTQTAENSRIYALAVTCRMLSSNLKKALERAVSRLQLKTEKILFLSYEESYYHYMLYQPEELWTERTVLFDYRGSRILTYTLEFNRNTVPVAALAETGEYPFPAYENMPEDEKLRFSRLERLDGELLELAEEVCRNRRIQSVYLIGENFSDEWMKASLKFFCSGRRVFQGNNLYSKGACYFLKEQLQDKSRELGCVFLGNDKLKVNVGMRLFKQGREILLPVLKAGASWFEAEETLEVYLLEGNCIEVAVAPLTGKGGKLAQIILEQLQGDVCRVRAHFYMLRENLMAVEIEDLGLGEFRPATHHVWKEEIRLY